MLWYIYILQFIRFSKSTLVLLPETATPSWRPYATIIFPMPVATGVLYMLKSFLLLLRSSLLDVSVLLFPFCLDQHVLYQKPVDVSTLRGIRGIMVRTLRCDACRKCPATPDRFVGQVMSKAPSFITPHVGQVPSSYQFLSRRISEYLENDDNQWQSHICSPEIFQYNDNHT